VLLGEVCRLIKKICYFLGRCSGFGEKYCSAQSESWSAANGLILRN
jgi:hypothetical protein